ncbi:MAG: hypothetical protein AABX23_00080 [Nanoarchaeota archaeon]
MTNLILKDGKELVFEDIPANYKLEHLAKTIEEERESPLFFVVFAPTPEAGEDYRGDKGYEGQRVYSGNGGYYHNFRLYIGPQGIPLQKATLRGRVKRYRGNETVIDYLLENVGGTIEFSDKPFNILGGRKRALEILH